MAKQPPPRASVRTDAGRFDGKPTPAGFGALKHRVKVLHNPPTLTGRREASRANAYPEDEIEDGV
jgi:hypothetical protein